MSKTISILGVEVTVDTPYAAGHIITEAEAKVLNQTRSENISNNFRKRIKAAQEGGENAETLDAVLADLRKYDQNYTFTMASGAASRSTITPLEKEANRLAKQWLVGQLKSKGSSLKAYIDAKGKDFVSAKLVQIAEQDSILAQAKKNLAAAEKNADAISVGLDD